MVLHKLVPMNTSYLFYLIFPGFFITLSCNKEESVNRINLTGFKDVILEIQDRNLAGSGKISIFNAYAYAIRLNEDGSFETFDDNYGQSEYWYSLNDNRYKWTQLDNNLHFTDSLSSWNVYWEILDIKENSMIIKELGGKDD
ncbi:MAG: hypothetical protein HC906_06870 [Bacteroidales bacterium]|nr:hypothetical protein [Bacteroidales bacterium]